MSQLIDALGEVVTAGVAPGRHRGRLAVLLALVPLLFALGCSRSAIAPDAPPTDAATTADAAVIVDAATRDSAIAGDAAAACLTPDSGAWPGSACGATTDCCYPASCIASVCTLCIAHGHRCAGATMPCCASACRVDTGFCP